MRKAIAVLFVLALTGAGDLFGKGMEISGAPPVRERNYLKKGRHELTPAIGLTISDPYVRSLVTQISYSYHFFHWLGVTADIAYLSSFNTALKEGIESELSKPGESFIMSTSSPQFIFDLGITVSPIIGKFMFLGQYLVYWDIHINAGGGLAMVNGKEKIKDSGSFAPYFGVGARFFVNKHLSVNLDFKDYFIKSELNSTYKGTTSDKKYRSNYMFLLGVSFYLPQEITVGK
ncbi:MAG: outer membrane beta-barrel domain-containing protein [Deltaproteobacteria bacterium]|nr:outer membrane beta-barrel domain-containing protein [Deltaproteobacteria bacterium]